MRPLRWRTSALEDVTEHLSKMERKRMSEPDLGARTVHTRRAIVQYVACDGRRYRETGSNDKGRRREKHENANKDPDRFGVPGCRGHGDPATHYRRHFALCSAGAVRMVQGSCI